MKIKRIDGKGNAVAYQPDEAVQFAIEYTAKKMNTSAITYWIDPRTIKVDDLKSLADKDGNWEAWVSGTVHVGRTDHQAHQDHIPKAHTFKVHYKLGKDEWGMPDLTLPSEATLTPIPTNPSEMVGPPPPAEATEAKPSKEKTKQART